MSENENTYLDEEEGVIELEDEDGNVSRFEFVDRAELDGVTYYALIPADYDEDETAEFVVLKETDINGEIMLATVDDDDEYNRAGEMFIQRFSSLPDIDLDDDDDGGEDGEDGDPKADG